MNDHNPFIFPGILICALGLLIPVVLTIFPPPNLVRYQEPQDNTLKHSEIVTAAYAKGEAKLAQAQELLQDLKLQSRKNDESNNSESGIGTEKNTEIVKAAFSKGEAKLEQAHELFHDLKALAKKADEPQNETKIADKDNISQ
ncbi:hypothetical protein RYA05_01010 [Pseudomonas syringae pv. actinidiae]|nr:hypothetical protein [Pseudomonas syringae pv. actinidiae]